MVSPRFGVFMYGYRTICSPLSVDLDFGVGITDHPAPNRPVDDYVRNSGSCAIFMTAARVGT